MATSDNSETIPKKPILDKTEDEEEPLIECAICLQTCIYPVQLPCKHIFCFLCVKGATTQSKRCAMCRAEIPPDYLDHPELISSLDSVQECTFEDGFQWFYEGRNGWWLYDERTGLEIEQFYKSGEKKCELLIAGFLYIIDFEHMMQFRRNDPNRRRQIKRDAATVPKKGIAGLRANASDEGTITPAITADTDGDGQDQTASSDSQQHAVRSQHPTRQAPQPPVRRTDQQSSVIRGPNQQSSSSITSPGHQASVTNGSAQQSPSQVPPPLTVRSNAVRQDHQHLSHSTRNQQQQPPLSRRQNQESSMVHQDLPIVRSQDGQTHSIRSQGQPAAVGTSIQTPDQQTARVTSRRSTNHPRPILMNPPDQQDSAPDNSADDISQQFSNLSVRVSSSLPNSGFYWGGSSPSDDPTPSYPTMQNVASSPPDQHDAPQ